VVPSYRQIPIFSNRKLPDLPEFNEFLDDKDSQNELAWGKNKNDPAVWNDDQNYCDYCIEQSCQGEKFDLFEIVSKIKEDT